MSNKNTGMSVKDMLLAGVTTTEMFNILKSQIDEAKAEIEAEKAAEAAKQEALKNDKLAEARKNLIKTMVDYMNLTGAFKEQVTLTDEDIAEICEQIEEYKKLATPLMDTLFSLFDEVDTKKPEKQTKSNKKHTVTADLDLDIDDIIAKFIETLE